MRCNWELFELRVIIYAKGKGALSEPGMFFANVNVDLQSLGIADFQGHNDFCNFETVFAQLIKLKTLPFSCRKKNNPFGEFARIQKAERDHEILSGAQLYVHRRDRSELTTVSTGVGIMLDDVTVAFTSLHADHFYAQLFGRSASKVNF